MTLLITNAGIAAAKRADNLGLDCKITHIAIGRAGYAPTKEQIQLQDEITRKVITRATSPELGQLHFEVQFDGDLSYEAKEIGYFLDDGTLLAVDSRNGEIISIKRHDSVVIEAFELNLADSEIKNVTVSMLESPLATEAVAGIAKIATESLVLSRVDDRSFLTVKKTLMLINNTAQFVEYNPNRKYCAGETCYTKNGNEINYWQWYSNVESLSGKNPLDLSNRHINWLNSDKPFYWVPYTGDQVGMPFYWLDVIAPEHSVMEINVNLPISVYWRLARRYPHLVSGGFINTGDIRSEFIRVLDQGRGVDVNRTINSQQSASKCMYTRFLGNGGHGGAGWSDELRYPHGTRENYQTLSKYSAAGGHLSVVNSSGSLIDMYDSVTRNVSRAMAISI